MRSSSVQAQHILARAFCRPAQLAVSMLLWLHHQQVDSLRTNHRGTFVLKDNQFRCRNLAAKAALLACRHLIRICELHQCVCSLQELACLQCCSASHRRCQPCRRWTRTLSADPVDGSGAGSGTTSPAAQEAAAEHLLLPCAVVRGALKVIGEDEVPLPISFQ